MGFTDNIPSVVNSAFNQLATHGVYNDGSADIDINVIIDESEARTNRTGITALAFVSKSDVPAPGYRHTITVDGVTWTVDQEEHGSGFNNDGVIWQLPVTRGQRTSQWRR